MITLVQARKNNFSWKITFEVVRRKGHEAGIFFEGRPPQDVAVEPTGMYSRRPCKEDP
jgi:hypothetical protein